MFTDADLKKTRFYREVFQEGLEEGRQEGLEEGRLEERRQLIVRRSRDLSIKNPFSETIEVKNVDEYIPS